MRRLDYLLIVLLISAIWVPFLDEPVFRALGDEKVYIAQALDMARSGTWFLQELNGAPNYYKGPVFYLLLRLGYELFGSSPLSIVYMNFLASILLSIVSMRFYREYLSDIDPWKRLLFSAMTATSTGSIAFLLSSQMDFLLMVIYTLAFYLTFVFSRCSNLKNSVLLWTAIGVASWLKSPLHSFLLGVSVISYILLCDRKAIFSSKLYWGIVAGVTTSIAIYLPILIMDFSVFWQTYILRETFQKGSNGVSVWMSLLPVVTYQFFPWQASLV